MQTLTPQTPPGCLPEALCGCDQAPEEEQVGLHKAGAEARLGLCRGPGAHMSVQGVGMGHRRCVQLSLQNTPTSFKPVLPSFVPKSSLQTYAQVLIPQYTGQ
jgi:hypothetical protein